MVVEYYTDQGTWERDERLEGYGVELYSQVAGPLRRIETRHATYQHALGYAQRQLEGHTGKAMGKVYRLEASPRYPDGIRWTWIETIGGIR